jgi:hypothetical protein
VIETPAQQARATAGLRCCHDFSFALQQRTANCMEIFTKTQYENNYSEAGAFRRQP